MPKTADPNPIYTALAREQGVTPVPEQQPKTEDKPASTSE